MKLLKYEGYKLTIEPELLTIKSFKDLWNRDKSKHKDRAISEIAFIYFYCDPRSDYQYITDNFLREEAIKDGEGLPKKWKPDKLIIEAMNYYLQFKTTATLLLEDTRTTIDKLRTFLTTVDFSETDNKGKLLYPINTITSTIKQIPELIEVLDKVEKTIFAEFKHIGTMRGQGEKTLFEDTLNL